MVGDIKTRLLNVVLQSNDWKQKHIEEVRATFATVRNYEEKKEDLTLQAGMPRSLLALWDLLESLLFTRRFYESIHTGLKAHRSAADILEADEFKDVLTTIVEAAKAERAEQDMKIKRKKLFD